MIQRVLDSCNLSGKRSALALLFIMTTALLFPGELRSQVISHSLLDLRTKIKKHPWSFHPGDSPVLTKWEMRRYKVKENDVFYGDIEDEKDHEVPVKDKKEKTEKTEKDNKTDNDKNSIKEIPFLWAQEKFKEDGEWINDIEIQLAWTRYRNSKNERPFKDFQEYKKKYKGYGWYRTSFIVRKEDFVKKFKSNKLVLRLGKIGQADAVYLNGKYIGGTGLKADTEQNSELADKKLFYDKIRYYKIPRSLLKIDTPNTLSVRVYAKYPIAPGLSHGKYYISSDRKMERSEFWDDFKKIFVIVLTLLLGLFYLYWNFMFPEQESTGMYFAFASLAMAANTFMQSQIVYSIWKNGLWIKKIEFISFIIFIHMLLEFFVHFTRVKSTVINIINRIWDFIGLAAVFAILFIPSMITARRIMFVWGVAPALVFLYLLFIIIKGRKIPSIKLLTFGFIGMVILLANDILVGFQFRWVLWEISMKDYAFAFFSLMAAASIVSNMKKSKELIHQQQAEKDRLSRYFSPDVVDTIIGGEVTLGGEEKPIATLFADIVGFTSYSETHAPAVVVSRLNEMFSLISEKIFQYKATLDKYIGDCIMAFWGAPNSSPKDAYNAIACGFKMQQVCEELNKNLPSDEDAFVLRVGINYGPSIVGNIGSHERMDYTVIGDAVNTASRIESNGIPGKVAISEAAFKAAGGEKHIKYSETRELTVKGKTEPLKIYLVEEVLPWEGLDVDVEEETGEKEEK